MGLRVLNGRVVKVREWLTLGVPFPVLYRVYGQLVTSITPGISGNKRGTGRKVFILEDQVDTSHPETMFPWPRRGEALLNARGTFLIRPIKFW